MENMYNNTGDMWTSSIETFLSENVRRAPTPGVLTGAVAEGSFAMTSGIPPHISNSGPECFQPHGQDREKQKLRCYGGWCRGLLIHAIVSNETRRTAKRCRTLFGSRLKMEGLGSFDRIQWKNWGAMVCRRFLDHLRQLINREIFFTLVILVNCWD